MNLTPIGIYGAYPQAEGGTSCYYLSGKRTNIVLDFGSGAMSRLSSLTDICKIDAIILSHLHADHCLDMLLLKYYLPLAGKRHIKVYMPKTECELGNLIRACEFFDINYIEDNTTFEIGEFTVRFYPMEHPVKTFAVRIFDGKNTLSYSADTSTLFNVEPLLLGADLFLCDCSVFSSERNATCPHVAIEDVLNLCKSNNTRIMMTHFMTSDLSRHIAAADAIGCAYLLAREMTVFRIGE